MELSAAVKRFLFVDRSPATNETYEKDMRQFVAFLGESYELADITPENIEDYLAHLRHRAVKYENHPTRPPVFEALQPATVDKHFKTLRTFFNWCVRRGWLDTSPASVVRIRRYFREPGANKAISAEELRQLIEYVDSTTRNRERNLAVFMFLADTGCRVGGCASLRLSMINWDDCSARLIEKGGKPTVVYFGKETRAALLEYLAVRPDTDHDYVWAAQGKHQHLTVDGIRSMIRRMGYTVLGRAVGPHGIRHRVGQSWAEETGNPDLVRLKLGHRLASFTVENYFNQDAPRLRAASQHLSLIALKGT